MVTVGDGTADMQQRSTRLASYQIPNSICGVSQANAWLADRITSLSVSEQTWFSMRLCLEEVMTNIITHAFADDDGHVISLSLSRLSDRLVLTISDDGVPFDPISFERQSLPGRLEDVEPGGQGIHLVRNFATDVHYRREGRTNHLELVFPLDS